VKRGSYAMLPSNLLRVRSRQGIVRPVFADLASDLDVARELIEIYTTSTGMRYGEISEKIDRLEERFDYKLVRGLSTLLVRRCDFQTISEVDPPKARMITFEIASRSLPVSSQERERVLREASGELRVEQEKLEKSLFADLESERILASSDPISPEVLLKYYNLSILQTLLFKALKFEFTASGNWKNIFREIKKQGLMYSVDIHVGGDGQSYLVTVDGPLSLLRMTDRYGTSMAKLVPHVISAPPWSLEADILARSKGRIYTFQLTSEEASDSLSDVTGVEQASDVYDSSLEERLARNFESMNTGWMLRREPEPLKAGTHVMIPDFSFEKAGYRVYLEIIGFWTEEYLNRKVAKLKQLSNNYDIIIAADESLACSKLSKARGDVIYFRKVVPIGPILAHLKKYDERILKAEANSLRIVVDDSMPVIKLIDVAKNSRVSVETVRRALASRNLQGFDLVGDMLISHEVLSGLNEQLTKCTRLSEAIAIMEDYGIDEPHPVLARLGFVVRYVSLDPDALEIKKAGGSSA